MERSLQNRDGIHNSMKLIKNTFGIKMSDHDQRSSMTGVMHLRRHGISVIKTNARALAMDLDLDSEEEDGERINSQRKNKLSSIRESYKNIRHRRSVLEKFKNTAR